MSSIEVLRCDLPLAPYDVHLGTAAVHSIRNPDIAAKDVHVHHESAADLTVQNVRDELFFPELVGESSESHACEMLHTLSTVFECVSSHASRDAHEQGASQIIPRSPFDGLRVPQISLHDYVHRISRYSKCSNVCFCMAFSYLRRLAEKNPVYRVSMHSAHRLLVTSVLLAAKLTDDSIYNNAYWAKVGGIPVGELNRLELLMLKELDYRLHVSEEEVAHTLRQLKVLARTLPRKHHDGVR